MEFDTIYRYQRLKHYQNLFSTIKEKPGSLSATEAFSAEIIYLLGSPTLGQFASFIGISQPNASYKVAALVSKGYIVKQTGETDKRECHLQVTDKFLSYYGQQLPDMKEFLFELSSEELSVLQKLEARILSEIGTIISGIKTAD